MSSNIALINFYYAEHDSGSSTAMPEEVLRILELHEAIRLCELPASLRNPVKKRGRKQYNRFLLIALIIYGLQHNLSYRQLEELAKANWNWLKPYSFNIKKAPDHALIYEIAKSLRATDIFRYLAKLKQLKGEIPCLWY